jgi:hypothetical protein
LLCNVLIKWVQTTMKEKKIGACLNIKKTHDKKWSIKHHNLCEINIILRNFNLLFIRSTFILVFLLKTHNCHSIITKLITCFHIFSFLPFMHIIITYYLHNLMNSYNLKSMKKKEVNRRLNTMHSIKMIFVSTC